MAEWGLAAQVKPPEPVDLQKLIGTYDTGIKFKSLLDYEKAVKSGMPVEDAAKTLAQYDPQKAAQMLATHQSDIDTRKLAEWDKTGRIESLRGASPEKYAVGSEAETRNYSLGARKMAQAAYQVLNTQDPKEKLRLWNAALDEGKKQGWVPKEVYDQYYGKPSDLVANSVIRRYFDIQTDADVRGETAGRRAGAQAPYQFHAGSPTERVQYPGQRPGSPTYGQPPAQPGSLKAPGAPPAVEQPIVPNVVQTAPVRPGTAAAPPVPLPAAAPRRTPSDQRGVAPGTPAAEVSATERTSPFYRDAPVMPIGPKDAGGPGVVQAGTHPEVARAYELGLKNLTEKLQPDATIAAKVRSNLGTMRSALESGRMDSDRLAPFKFMLAGILAAAPGSDNEKAKALVGIDLPTTEIFTKESTRMGLTFARQTEGAREAVQAIQIALGANPQLLTSKEGNLKILSILEESAKWDEDRANAAQAYFAKQRNEHGDAHLIGFDQWYNSHNPPRVAISKAVPYQLPMENGRINPAALEKGVTYEWPAVDPQTRRVIIDPRTRQPKMQKGVWNPDTQSLD